MVDGTVTTSWAYESERRHMSDPLLHPRGTEPSRRYSLLGHGQRKQEDSGSSAATVSGQLGGHRTRALETVQGELDVLRCSSTNAVMLGRGGSGEPLSPWCRPESNLQLRSSPASLPALPCVVGYPRVPPTSHARSNTARRDFFFRTKLWQWCVAVQESQQLQ
jgi:hypothetical protein